MYRRSPLSLVLLLVAGCAAGEYTASTPAEDLIGSLQPADVTTLESAREVFERSHPAGALELIVAALFVTDFAAEAGACPVKVDASTSTVVDTTYTGGCTNEGATTATHDDQIFAGQIRVSGSQSNYTVVFDEFQISHAEICRGDTIPLHTSINGALRVIEGYSELDTTYELNIVYDATAVAELEPGEACEVHQTTHAYDYVVEIVTAGRDTDANGVPDELVSFTGSGAMAAFGVGSWTTSATLEHSSIDELSEGVECTEPLTGQIEVSADGHVAKLIADGDAQCTLDACAQWELDGKLQPNELCGVGGCSLTHSQNRQPWLVLLALFGLLAVLARRR